MKKLPCLVVMLMATATLSGSVLAQGRGAPAFWAAKPALLTPYVAPNRVHWKLSDILASHREQSDWVQPMVRNPEMDGDYISMGSGKKTKPQFYADDRLFFVVWDGSLRVTIQGKDAFVATKGFMVNVPARHVYSLETVGSTPALRFEVRQAGAPPLYPGSETPEPRAGVKYVKVTGTPGPWVDRDTNPPYFDFFRTVAAGGKLPAPAFVRDDHFTANVIRGAAAPVPPDTELGHFHVGITEFWFIMEGSIGYKIEGFPYFRTDPGDVVIAAKGRWHRTGNDPVAPFSTRIPINPRPPALHNFEVGAAAGD